MYRSPNIVRVIKSRRLEDVRSAFKILSDKPTGKRPLRWPRHGWEDNIRMDLKEIDINTRNWADLVRGRDYCKAFMNAALNLHAPETM